MTFAQGNENQRITQRQRNQENLRNRNMLIMQHLHVQKQNVSTLFHHNTASYYVDFIVKDILKLNKFHICICKFLLN